jgi:hypothetical protein
VLGVAADPDREQTLVRRRAAQGQEGARGLKERPRRFRHQQHAPAAVRGPNSAVGRESTEPSGDKALIGSDARSVGSVTCWCLGLRRDGAQEIEPLLRCHTGGEDPLAGTYALLLAHDPDVAESEFAPWLVLYTGHIPPAGFWTTPTGAQLTRFSCTDHPILLLPRPAAATWWISVATAPFVPTIPTTATSAFTPTAPTATPGDR